MTTKILRESKKVPTASPFGVLIRQRNKYANNLKMAEKFIRVVPSVTPYILSIPKRH